MGWPNWDPRTYRGGMTEDPVFMYKIKFLKPFFRQGV